MTWKQRMQKRDWARKNYAIVAEANRRWRAANQDKVRRQARERMKRYRQRYAKLRAATKQT
jgi:hypothetical protein